MSDTNVPNDEPSSPETQTAQVEDLPAIDLSRSPSHLLYLARQRADEIVTIQLATVGITPRQFTFLYAIYTSPGLNQKDLSQITGSDRSTVAELVSRLQKRGMINRIRSTKDARSTILELTEAGRRTVEHAHPHAATADQHLLNSIEMEQREAFLDTLSKLAAVSNV